MNYFRQNAHQLVLGSYGEKKDPIGPAAHLEPQNKVRPEHLVERVRVGDPLRVDFSDYSRNTVEVEGPLRVFGIGIQTATSYDYEALQQGTLSLLDFYIPRVEGERRGSQSFELAPGSTFAYRLHKVKRWEDGKSRVKDMESDYKGMG